MKWRSLRYDKNVKPSWRKMAECFFWIFMLSNGARVFIRDYDKYNHGKYGDVEDFLFWISILSAFVCVVLWLMYLIKPKLFKLNKEQ